MDYLDRNLEQRARALHESFRDEIEAIMRRHAKDGRLASGSTIVAFKNAALNALQEQFKSGAVFTFNIVGQVDERASLAMDTFCRKMAYTLARVLENASRRTGLVPVDIDPQIDAIKKDLEFRYGNLLEDFSNGMLGDEKLKKDPSFSITNTQTNSPGAVQQVGSANVASPSVSQQSLAQEIERVLASIEFKALPEVQQLELKDITDVVKGELEKPTADPGKLARWGRKLVGFTSDVGMKLASETIASYLAKMSGV